MKNMYNVKLSKTNSMKFIFMKNKICTNIKKRVACKLKGACQRYFWKLVILFFILRSQKTRSLGFPQELCLVLLTIGTILDHLKVKWILPAALQVPATPFMTFPLLILIPETLSSQIHAWLLPSLPMHCHRDISGQETYSEHPATSALSSSLSESQPG